MKSKKLKCVITGRVLFATADYYKRKLDKYDGDENKMLSHYMCKEAKRLIQQGYTVDTTRKMLNIDQTTVQPVDDDIITEVLNSTRRIPRLKTGYTVNNMNMTHQQTDPDVKKFIDTITQKNK